jgi:ABC-2 type transport system ATP-binding protein
MPPDSPAIVVEHLTKRFGGRPVVDDVSLEVAAGQLVGFLGPNGAGKTTTIGMLLGLIRPDAGRIALFGEDVGRDPGAALRRVGAMVEPALYPYLSGRDNLRVLARAAGIPEGRAQEALAQVSLTEHAGVRFGRYSRGMRQRLGIAAALLGGPALLVLDEPTEGLDPAGRHEVHELLRGLARDGRTVFFSSHVLGEVERLCERVAILDRGRLIAEGRVDDLLRGATGITVRVAGDPARALEVLRAVPGVSGVTCDGDVLQVDAAAARAAELNALLVARGVDVAEIRSRERHLEDVFLALTGEAGAR